MRTDTAGSSGTPTRTATAVGDGSCERCGDPAYLTAYWGEKLCQECTWALAELFDQKGEWPHD